MEKYFKSDFERVILFQKYSKWFVKVCTLILNTLQNNPSRFMKFKRSYSNARHLGSAYKFAFGGDVGCKPRLFKIMSHFKKWNFLNTDWTYSYWLIHDVNPSQLGEAQCAALVHLADITRSTREVYKQRIADSKDLMSADVWRVKRRALNHERAVCGFYFSFMVLPCSVHGLYIQLTQITKISATVIVLLKSYTAYLQVNFLKIDNVNSLQLGDAP